MKTPINAVRNTRLASGLSLIAALVLYAGPVTAADAYKEQTGSTAGAYQIDPDHSSARFTAGHLGVAEMEGRFNTISGSFSIDPGNSEQARVSVQIPIDSLDSNHAKRNTDLLGPDFFNAKQFPTMSFTGTKLQWHGKNTGQLSGNLTLHGVTKPVIFDLRHIGAGPDPWGGYRSGYVATATIKRSDFRMNYMLNGISDAIQVQMNIEGKRQ